MHYPNIPSRQEFRVHLPQKNYRASAFCSLFMSETNTLEEDLNEVSGKRQRVDDSSYIEDESIVCSICSEVWTAGGSHCLVSLKCGHLFGRKCIEKWIEVQKTKGKAGSCPNCKKSAVIKDIRIVLPIKISAIDNTEKDELSKELESKKYKIRDCQEAVALSTMSLNLLKKQLQRAKEDYDLLDP